VDTLPAMSDPRIQAAIDHWAPCYVEHGVPVGDFLDVTRAIGSWDDWCSAWSAAAAVHESEGDTALSAGYSRSAALHYTTAAAAIDALEGRGDVDTDRIGALGVSLGGYYVIRASAFEKRIKALISLSGPFEIGSSLDHIPPMSQLAFITRTHSANLDEAKEHLRAMDLTDVVHLVDQPAFIVTGALDRLVPAEQTSRIAEGVSGEVFLNVIPDANHVATNKAHLYRPHMADWMAERLAT
jgi:dienelactone hydrolase